MAKRKKRWVYAPPKMPKPKVPDSIKVELTQKANEIIQTQFKPWRSELDKGTKEKRFNYIVDLYTTWWRNYFYFCSKYHCPGPRAISEYFESRFTRMEYVGEQQFNLSYMRHTGQWWKVYEGMTLEECLETIKNEQIFWP